MSVSKIVAAAASGVGGAGLDIDEVFSCHLYEGTGSGFAVNNGIDLSGEGGLVWIKKRNAVKNHGLMDTERGLDGSSNSRYLKSNTTDAQATGGLITAYNSNGFTLGAADMTNGSGEDYVSWTFRKAPKFFDCISIDVADPEPTTVTVNHNLGQQVGMVIMKPYLHTYPWHVWHSSLSANKFLELNTTAAEANFGGTGFSSTSTTITIPGSFVHSGSSNGKCILYLFANNNNNGEFGPDADSDAIKCGIYTGNGNATGPIINLGFTPQWLLVKCSSTSGSGFVIMDNRRGFTVDGAIQRLETYNSNGESAKTYIGPTSNGFQPKTTDVTVNGNGQKYIYMAIRRGPLAAPDDATKVFAIDTRGSTGDGKEPAFRSTFPVDFALQKIKNSGTNWTAKTRLLGKKDLNPNTSSAEQGANNNLFDYMNGHFAKTNTDANEVGWMWKRAPSYFDVVHYNTSSYPISVPHSLTVTPEMIWYKDREHGSSWAVWHKDVTGYLYLNADNAVNTYTGLFGTPTATVVIFDNLETNNNCVAYLFATLAGISKVGNFSLSGSNVNVDCGFSNGSRFILIKRTDGASNWYVFDTLRGIASGNDAALYLNDTTAQQSANWIEPLSSGFQVRSSAWSNGTYIFYAIA